jgi:hypothetical protein
MQCLTIPWGTNVVALDGLQTKISVHQTCFLILSSTVVGGFSVSPMAHTFSNTRNVHHPQLLELSGRVKHRNIPGQIWDSMPFSARANDPGKNLCWMGLEGVGLGKNYSKDLKPQWLSYADLATLPVCITILYAQCRHFAGLPVTIITWWTF